MIRSLVYLKGRVHAVGEYWEEFTAIPIFKFRFSALFRPTPEEEIPNTMKYGALEFCYSSIAVTVCEALAACIPMILMSGWDFPFAIAGSLGVLGAMAIESGLYTSFAMLFRAERLWYSKYFPECFILAGSILLIRSAGVVVQCFTSMPGSNLLGLILVALVQLIGLTRIVFLAPPLTMLSNRAQMIQIQKHNDEREAALKELKELNEHTDTICTSTTDDVPGA
ncbi:MAG: hypothetical protein RSC43_00850 [Clostridia bacterium]